MKPARRPAHQPGLIPPRNRHLRQPTSTWPAAGPAVAPAAQPPVAPTRWDTWLSRGASVAQIVGVVLALAGLFYTVIPLYQKAAVDEQLARREAELKVVEAKLAEAKTELYRVKRDNYMSVATREAARECSDAVKDFTVPRAEGRRRPGDYRWHMYVNVVDCVEQYLAKAEADKELSQVDMTIWRTWASSLAKRLEARRLNAVTALEELPAKAALDPKLLEVKNPFLAQAERALKRQGGASAPTPEIQKEWDERDFERKLRAAEDHLVSEHRSEVARQLHETLEPQAWRDERAKREAAARAGVGASSANH